MPLISAGFREISNEPHNVDCSCSLSCWRLGAKGLLWSQRHKLFCSQPWGEALLSTALVWPVSRVTSIEIPLLHLLHLFLVRNSNFYLSKQLLILLLPYCLVDVDWQRDFHLHHPPLRHSPLLLSPHHHSYSTFLQTTFAVIASWESFVLSSGSQTSNLLIPLSSNELLCSCLHPLESFVID